MRFAPIKFAAALLLTAAGAVPALAEPAPSPDDDAAISALIDPSLAALKAGKSRQAVDVFLGKNTLTANKTSDLAMLTSQIDSVIAIYGPIGDCQLVQTRNNGAWVQQRLYICQHANLATRWIYQVVHTSKGWTSTNMSFDDKVTNRLEE